MPSNSTTATWNSSNSNSKATRHCLTSTSRRPLRTRPMAQLAATAIADRLQRRIHPPKCNRTTKQLFSSCNCNRHIMQEVAVTNSQSHLSRCSSRSSSSKPIMWIFNTWFQSISKNLTKPSVEKTKTWLWRILWRTSRWSDRNQLKLVGGLQLHRLS